MTDKKINDAFNSFGVKKPEIENEYTPLDQPSKYEYALIMIIFCLILLGLLAFSISNVSNDSKAEELRRSEMYKYIGDEKSI